MKAYGSKDKRGQRADKFTCCDQVNGCCRGHRKSPVTKAVRKRWRSRARQAGKEATQES